MKELELLNQISRFDVRGERLCEAVDAFYGDGAWGSVIAAMKDAARYRWLRAIPNELRADHDWNPAPGGWDAPIYWHGLHKPGDELQGSELDDAIDAAMKGANKNSTTPMSHNTVPDQ